MKSIKPLILINLLLVCCLATGCSRSRDEVWDDTKTAKRHMGRGIKTLGGKHGDSRQVCSREDFMCLNEDDLDFIPMHDEENLQQIAFAETEFRQAKNEPGDPRSHLPGIDGFEDPLQNSELALTFRRIHFPYNSSLIKGEENLKIVRGIANYMKKHSNTYLYVEGHCDERGAEAYNLALGARRANSVRNLLLKEGVSPDNVFTVSYGKERPIAYGHDEGSWNKNRRAQFRIYR